MEPEREAAEKALERAVEWVEQRRKAGWPPLSDAYLAHIARVEAMPQNQSGADKSWVWRADRRNREHFKRARRCGDS